MSRTLDRGSDRSVVTVRTVPVAGRSAQVALSPEDAAWWPYGATDEPDDRALSYSVRVGARGFRLLLEGDEIVAEDDDLARLALRWRQRALGRSLDDLGRAGWIGVRASIDEAGVLRLGRSQPGPSHHGGAVSPDGAYQPSWSTTSVDPTLVELEVDDLEGEVQSVPAGLLVARAIASRVPVPIGVPGSTPASAACLAALCRDAPCRLARRPPALAARAALPLTERTVACPACAVGGADAVTPLFAPDVGRCASCGTVVRDPRPSQESIVAAYDADLGFATWERDQGAVRTAQWHTRLALLRRHQGGGTLLDVGTGDGHFLAVAEAHFDVHATEPSASGRARVGARGYHADVDLDTVQHPVGGFSAITMWHVLEHVPDPLALLRSVRSIIATDGIIVVATPNEVGPLGSGATDGVSPFGHHVVGLEIHLTHFVPDTLRGVVARAGFEVVEFGVDDAHLERGPGLAERLDREQRRALTTGTHEEPAMYVVARPAGPR